MLKEKKKNRAENPLDLEQKKTRGDKLYLRLGLACGAISFSMWIFILIMHTAAPQHSVATWFFLFYPLLIVVILGLVITMGQLLRNRHLTSIIAAVLCIVSAVALIVIIIAQPIIYGEFFVLPFYFL